jgi:hypothetical protein
MREKRRINFVEIHFLERSYDQMIDHKHSANIRKDLKIIDTITCKGDY